jgi:hypothetical protein
MSKHVDLWILIAPALLFATALAPATVCAEGEQLRVQTQLEYISADIEQENRATGEKTDSEFSFFRQKYDLEFQKTLFPYLYLRTGGHFELIDSKSEREDTTSGYDEKTERVFGELHWTNPLYSLAGTYRRRNFEFDPREGPSLTLHRDEYSGAFEWRPVGLPSLDVDFNRFHTWSDDDDSDSLFKQLIAKTRYDYRDFSADYSYTRSDQERRIDSAVVSGGLLPAIATPTESGSLTQIHNGGLRYSRRFLGDRLELTGGARVNYDELEPSGTEPFRPPTTSTGRAFFLLDDSDPSTLTKVDGANPLSTVNIGQGAPPDPVGIGLDFEVATEVDTLYLLPLEDASDPALASPGEIASVAGLFNWEVFSSNDQVNWTPHIVASAKYRVFDNRFEIVFSPRADARYVKAVTKPVPTATGEIRISELQGFTTFPSSPDSKFETLTQTYNFGLLWAATDRTTTTYDALLRIVDTDPLDRDRTLLVNSVGISHEFNPIFYGTARVLRADTDESDRDDSVRHTYTASLTADYLPTLDQTLIYSGTHEKTGGRTSYTNSLLLRTNADVYRDASVSLDLGYSMITPLEGPDTTSTTLRLATNIYPHRTLNFSVDYLGSYDTERGGDSGLNHIGRFQAFWVPTRTLSFFAAVNLRDQEREARGLQVSQQYAVNWSPFPDGQLNFLFGYSYLRDSDDNETRQFTPQVNWQIRRATLLTLIFSFGTIESNSTIQDVRSLRVNFRTLF